METYKLTSTSEYFNFSEVHSVMSSGLLPSWWRHQQSEKLFRSHIFSKRGKFGYGCL